MSDFILCIETATLNCSVAIFKGHMLVAHQQMDDDKYIHSEKLHVFIEQALTEADIEPKDLSAVAVSAGPGSYTGLRIGVSAAKGLCFALNIPLIAIPTPTILFYTGRWELMGYEKYITLLDARRMEAYATVYNAEGNMLASTEAIEISENSFAAYQGQSVVFFGDGSDKCRELFTEEKWVFTDKMLPDAQFVGKEIFDKFERKEFEDLAYFEPDYIKSFVAGKPKDLLKQIRKK